MSERDKLFRVQTTDGTWVAAYGTREQAEASAAERNARAEAMGIVARYKAAAN